MGDDKEAWIRCKSLTYHIPPNSTIRLGRSIESDLRLLTDTAASREHCVLTFLDGRLEARDLNSLNGTAVNGQLISVPTQLQHNDVISVGETALTILFELDQDDRGTENFRLPT
jgi:pSer/pThr/pTyr-binding forkhead associated (FHA) protein